jgi:hypothetical protein
MLAEAHVTVVVSSKHQVACIPAAYIVADYYNMLLIKDSEKHTGTCTRSTKLYSVYTAISNIHINNIHIITVPFTSWTE